MQLAIIYSRVSTVGQSNDRQVEELKAIDGYRIKKIFTESISGYIKSINERPILQDAIKYVKKNQIDVILVHEISRLGRNTVEVLQLIEQLKEQNIKVFVKSLGITMNDNSASEPINRLIITLMADLARLESENLSFRIKSGLEERKRKGLTLGRRVGSTEDRDKFLSKHHKVVKYLERGESIRWIANQLSMSPTTVQKVRSRM
ncbi:recombinase family protein [Ekhidna sp. MALMAid0563]|uniref:recombinase family protein n=1 Tax=Ekhidna sp. MALMAid0563 TaxID=3143937 RepID=UPI0032DEE6C7